MIEQLTTAVDQSGGELLDWVPNVGHLHEGARLLVRHEGVVRRWWIKFERDDLYGAGVTLETAALALLRPRLAPDLIHSGTVSGRRFLLTADAPGRVLAEHLADLRPVDWSSLARWLVWWRGQAKSIALVRRALGFPYSLLGHSSAVLVHGSWDPSNVLVTDDGQLSAVLDFEACGGGQQEHDIASMAVRLIELAADPDPWIQVCRRLGLCGPAIGAEIARRQQLRDQLEHFL